MAKTKDKSPGHKEAFLLAEALIVMKDARALLKKCADDDGAHGDFPRVPGMNSTIRRVSKHLKDRIKLISNPEA